MLRLALIGGGRTVRIAHAPALQALRDRFQVVALADQSPETLEATGMQLGIAVDHRYTNYHDMLYNEEFDVVDIALPHAFHHEAAMAALRAGAHLITERPLALSVRDAEEVLRLAEQRGKQVNVLHFYLYYPPFREGIRLVREGAIGEPFFVRCEGVTGGFGAGTGTYHPEWHNDPEIAGGGVWVDSGYHSVYLCAALVGSPVSAVAAHIGARATEMRVDDTAAALLTHRNGAASSVQVSWAAPSGGMRVFEVYGSEGTVSFDHEGYPLGIFSNASHTWHHPDVPVARDQSFIDCFQAIYECLRFGAPPPVSHRDALHVLRAVLAGYQASTDRTVAEVAG